MLGSLRPLIVNYPKTTPSAIISLVLKRVVPVLNMRHCTVFLYLQPAHYSLHALFSQ
jgi:hypothetical protein